MVRSLVSSLLLAACCLGGAQAEEGGRKAFTLSGFGTLGVARSSSEHAEFVRDLSQTAGLKNGDWSGRIDSVLGLQANWQLNPEWELVGQMVSRLHYDRSHNPELMWAFAKWEPDARLTLRGGRIGADFMMLADSRLVGYSYLPVRPSADFFGPLFFSHFDGADASLTLPLADGLVRGKVFGGWTHEKTAGAPGIWDTSGSPVAGAILDYQTGPWMFRANYAQIRFASDINFSPLPAILRGLGENAAADALVTKDKLARFYSLGVVYDDGPLQVQGMLNRIDQQAGVFQNSHAGYLLAGYRLGSVTPYAGYSWWKSDYKNFPTAVPVPPFNAVLAASTSDQVTYTFGARWDFYRNLALKLQWDAVRGQAASKFPFARTDAAWNGKTDVLSVTMDFVF
jgi:hypothetical protein